MGSIMLFGGIGRKTQTFLGGGRFMDHAMAVFERHAQELAQVAVVVDDEYRCF